MSAPGEAAARAVPITAHALVNALGCDSARALKRVFAGENALSAPTQWDLPFATMVGEMPALPAAKLDDARADSRIVRIAWQALLQIEPEIARARARYGAARVALVVGSSTGGMAETERAHPQLRFNQAVPSYHHDQQHPLGAMAQALQRALQLTGPLTVVSTACSSSLKALGCARRLLRAKLADCALVLGVDSLCALTLYGFHSLGVLSAQPTRPFSAARDGISLGEGAAAVLLEPAGESDVYFAGIGESSDAHHLSAPDAEGLGMAAAMRAALRDAGLTAEQIGHINAHGTGTPQNDAAEAKAICALFQRPIPVVSNKAAFGHQLGAGGLSEAVVALESLRRGVIAQLAHDAAADDALGLTLVRDAHTAAGTAVLNNSFGFGGSNVSAVFTR